MVDGLKALLDKGTHPYTPDQVHDWIIEGSWVTFARYDGNETLAYFVCRIKPPVFEVGLCWGTGMNEWLDDTLETFELIARQSGCNKLSVVGRPGWSKIGRSRGFHPKALTIVKELE